MSYITNLFYDLVGSNLEQEWKDVFRPTFGYYNDEQISISLPGVKKENIKITKQLVRDTVRIKVTATDRKGKEIEREFLVSNKIDFDKISSHYEDGMLDIRIPRKEETKKKEEEEVVEIK